jgi:hypothetical protein
MSLATCKKREKRDSGATFEKLERGKVRRERERKDKCHTRREGPTSLNYKLRDE